MCTYGSEFVAVDADHAKFIDLKGILIDQRSAHLMEVPFPVSAGQTKSMLPPRQPAR